MVPLMKPGHVQFYVKFLNDPEEDWEMVKWNHVSWKFPATASENIRGLEEMYMEGCTKIPKTVCENLQDKIVFVKNNKWETSFSSF